MCFINTNALPTIATHVMVIMRGSERLEISIMAPDSCLMSNDMTFEHACRDGWVRESSGLCTGRLFMFKYVCVRVADL